MLIKIGERPLHKLNYVKNQPHEINYKESYKYTHKPNTTTVGRLIVFGDSYAHSKAEQSWPNILSEKLGVELINYAVSGTSLNYSIQQFFNYYRNEYQSDDYIVFVTTSTHRIPFTLDGGLPSWQAGIHTYLTDPSKLTDPQYKYYHGNKKFWDIYYQQAFKVDDYYNQIEMIYNFLNNLSNTVLIIPGFNCFQSPQNKLKDNFTMYTISRLEGNVNFDDLNHMSLVNRKVLAELAYKYFTVDANYDIFTPKEFTFVNS